MSDADINIKINVDGADLGKAGTEVDNLGKKTEQTTHHAGGLRKELRALGEASKVGGEALGQFGSSVSAVGEGGKIAYAGLELMNGGLKGLATTLAANPIFLLAAAIAAIVVVMIDMNKENEKSEKEFRKAQEAAKDYGKEVKKALSEAAQATDDLLLSQGKLSKTEYEINKARREGGNELQAAADKQSKILSDLNASAEEAAKRYGKSLTLEGKLFGERTKALEEWKKRSKALEDFKKQIRTEDAAIAIKTSQKQKTAIQDDFNEKQKELDKQHKEELKKAEEAAKAQAELDKKYRDAKADALNKEIDAEEKRDKERKLSLEKQAKDAEVINKEADEYDKKRLTQKNVDKAKLNAEQNKFDLNAQLDYLNAEMKQELENTNLTQQEKALIEEKYRQEKIQKNQEAADRDLQIAQSLNTSLQGLSDAYFSVKEENDEKGSESALKHAKQQFKINKALALTSAVISGAEAVLKSIETLGPPVYPNILGIIGIATVAATNIAQIAKISSTQFKESGSASAGSNSSASAGSSRGNFTPQSLQRIGNGQPGFDGPNNPYGTKSKKDKEPQKIYVVSSDITSSQSKDAVLSRRASFNVK